MAFLGMSCIYEGNPEVMVGVEVLQTDWSKGWVSLNDLAQTSTKIFGSLPPGHAAFARLAAAVGDPVADEKLYVQKSSLVFAFIHQKHYKPINSWAELDSQALRWAQAVDDAVSSLTRGYVG